MQINTKVSFRFMLIGISFVFFFNSNINIVDIIPDFAGYILLGVGIGHLYLINDFYAKARNLSFYLCVITFVKFVISFFVQNFNSIDTLLITTCFNFAEIFMAVNLFENIFKANEIFLELNDNFSYAYKTAFYKIIVKIFLFLKYILGILSESVALINQDFIDRLYFNQNIYVEIEGMRNVAVLVCFIIVTLLGVFILSLILPYFHSLSKNQPLADKINVLTFRVENVHRIIFFEKFNIVFLFLYLSVFFLFELKFDEINVLPDFLAVSLVLTVLFIFRKMYNKLIDNAIILTSAAAILLSSAAYTFHIAEITTYTDRVLSASYTDDFLVMSNIFSVYSNLLLVVVFSRLYLILEKIRTENMNYAESVLNLYITKTEKEKNANRILVYIYMFSAFSVKSAFLFIPANSVTLLIYTIISVIMVIYSIYKLAEIRKQVNSYYVSVSNVPK